MSGKTAKITDSFSVVKKTNSLTSKYPQKKVRNEVISKDDRQKVYPEVKDVRDLQILKDFDLRCEYGPCIGITRLQRWTRAQEYGLNPPDEVEEILDKHAGDTKFTECLWYEEELY